MIRYDLKCSEGHAFDAWFRDSTGFEAQQASGSVLCPLCGSPRVTKSLMAPAIGKGAASAEVETRQPADAVPALSAKPETPLAEALVALRQKLETDATYVGRCFPAKAREQHESGDDTTPIWGEATPKEAEALTEDGIPITPLPPLHRRND